MDLIFDELRRRLGDDPDKSSALDELQRRYKSGDSLVLTPTPIFDPKSISGAQVEPPKRTKKLWGPIDTRRIAYNDPSMRQIEEKGFMGELNEPAESITETSAIENLKRLGKNWVKSAANLARFPAEAIKHPAEAAVGTVKGTADIGARLFRGIDPEKEKAFLSSAGEIPNFPMRVNKWLAQQTGREDTMVSLSAAPGTVKPWRLTDSGPQWLTPNEEAKAREYLRGLATTWETRLETFFKMPLETAMMLEGTAKGMGIGKKAGSTVSAKTGVDKEMLAAGWIPEREPATPKSTWEPPKQVRPPRLQSIGPQQMESRVSSVLSDPKFPEHQPVAQWIQLLQTKQFPKDSGAINKTLADLKKRPLKERLTKNEVQDLLNKSTPQLETVVARNPTHPEREGELFVRDPNEKKPTIEQKVEGERLSDEYNQIMRDYAKIEKEWHKELDKPHGTSNEVLIKELWDQLDLLHRRRVDVEVRLGDMFLSQRNRYDGHSWAQRQELSEPLGRTGFYTKNNPDGSKTLVIDNFQMPTEGSGGREAMPPEHAKRAYDLMAQSVLNYAREKGYRDVEWTTGMEQNRRWGVVIPEKEFHDRLKGAEILPVPGFGGGYEIVDSNGVRFVGQEFKTKENAIKYLEDVKKQTTPEGDLRPLYDKTIPKLMEKYGLGEKVVKNEAQDSPRQGSYQRLFLDNMKNMQELRSLYEDHLDILEGMDEMDEMEVLREVYGGIPTGPDLFNVFPDSYDIDPDMAIDIINAIRKRQYGKQKAPVRQSIRVEGQEHQPLLYSKTGMDKEVLMAGLSKKQQVLELQRQIKEAKTVEERAALGRQLKEVIAKQEVPKEKAAPYSPVKEGGSIFQSTLVNAFDDPSFPKGKMNGPQLYKELKKRQVTDAEIKQVYGDMNERGIRDVDSWKSLAERDAVELGEDVYGENQGKPLELNFISWPEGEPLTFEQSMQRLRSGGEVVSPSGEIFTDPVDFNRTFRDESGKRPQFSSWKAIKSQEGVVPRSYTEEFVTLDGIPIDLGGRDINTLSRREMSDLINKHTWRDEHSQYGGTKNPMIRIRYDVKEMPDGRRVLRLHEIQPPKEVTESTLYDAEKRAKKVYEDSMGLSVLILGKEIKPWAELVEETKKKLIKAQLANVPTELADRAYAMGIKQAIAKAKQMGLDGIEWATGEQTRDLYDNALRAIADEARWNPETEKLTLYKNGIPNEAANEVLPERVPKDKLKEYIGDSGAERLLGSTKNVADWFEDIDGWKLVGTDYRIDQGKLSGYYNLFKKDKWIWEHPDLKKAQQFAEERSGKHPEHIATDLSIDARWPGKLYGDFSDPGVRANDLTALKLRGEVDGRSGYYYVDGDYVILDAEDYGLSPDEYEDARYVIQELATVEQGEYNPIFETDSVAKIRDKLSELTGKTYPEIKPSVAASGDFDYSATVPSLLKKYGKGEFGKSVESNIARKWEEDTFTPEGAMNSWTSSTGETIEKVDYGVLKIYDRFGEYMGEAGSLSSAKELVNDILGKEKSAESQPVMWFTKDTPKTFPIYEGVTGVFNMLQDAVKKEGGGAKGVAKVAFKYGIPATLIAKFLSADKDTKEKMLRTSLKKLNQGY